MNRTFEGKDILWAGRLCCWLNENPGPYYGDEPTLVRVKFDFEDEYLGISIRLDGAGETYVVVIDDE